MSYELLISYELFFFGYELFISYIMLMFILLIINNCFYISLIYIIL
jgi:hypothetical protein